MTDIKVVSLTAEYGGWCLSCGAEVEVGQAVYWVKNAGVWHRDCERPRSLAMYQREADQKRAQHRPRFDP